MKEILTKLNALFEFASEGEIDPLKTFTELHTIEAYIKSIKAECLELALIERRKYAEKSVSLYGYSIEMSRGGRYEYKHIQAWTDANEKLKFIEKNAQMAYQAGKNQLISEDGEINEPAHYNENKESLRLKKIK